MTTKEHFIRNEERMNVITHGFGVLLSLAGFAALIHAAWKQDKAWYLAGVIIYGLTLIMMFAVSTMMHSLPEGNRKIKFVIFDHMSIYIFIAGTYTPFLLIAVGERKGLYLLGLIWGAAAAGIIYKKFYTGRYMWLSTLGYLVMGWFVAVLWNDLSSALGVTGLYMLLAGGICYTAGIVFFVWERLPYHHAIWHLFVLAGAALHYGCVYLIMTN
ncbi:PAQR family membrane homeostasis protein TrhA [Paenibacillus marinisediminis]